MSQLLLNVDGVTGSGKTYTIMQISVMLQEIAGQHNHENPLQRAAPTGVLMLLTGPLCIVSYTSQSRLLSKNCLRPAQYFDYRKCTESPRYRACWNTLTSRRARETAGDPRIITLQISGRTAAPKNSENLHCIAASCPAPLAGGKHFSPRLVGGSPWRGRRAMPSGPSPLTVSLRFV
jgi:hypothetical protein